MTDTEALTLWRYWVSLTRGLARQLDALARKARAANVQVGREDDADDAMWPGNLIVSVDLETTELVLEKDWRGSYGSDKVLARGPSVAALVDTVRPRVECYIEHQRQLIARTERVLEALDRR